MDRINNIQKFIVATISSITTGYFINLLSESIHNTNFIIFLSLLITIVIIGLLNYLVENLIDHSSRIRKMLLGDDYIEGYWYDITLGNNKEMLWATLVHIYYDKGALKVNGLQYRESGDKVCVFKSTYAVYHDKTLFFEYRSLTNAIDNFVEHGITQQLFENPAQAYTGFYIDYTNSLRFLIHGIKVTKGELKKHNNLKQTVNRKQYLLEKINSKENPIFENSINSTP
jgi:hypothetical protein